jgi:hypothetical protein
MPTALTAAIRASVSAQYQNLLDHGQAEYKPQINFSLDFADGAGAGQAQKIFTDTRTLAASASEDLDLNGVLTDAFGASLAFAEIKAIMIKAAAANTNNITIGGAATNQFVSPFGAGTHTLTLRPGGVLLLVAGDATGYAVTAGTGDLLKIANAAAGSSITYDIVLIGN